MTDIHATLADIQHQMRAPKNKNNSFGGYKYRNAEGILAAFKSLGIEGASLTCTDSLQELAGQIFVTSTARLSVAGVSIEAVGHAMHPLQKKGMDASQITGSASSYARKYALCGLFAIEDESQDPDARDNREEAGQTGPSLDDLVARAKRDMSNAKTVADLGKVWKGLGKAVQAELEAFKDARKAELTDFEPAGPDVGDGQYGVGG